MVNLNLPKTRTIKGPAALWKRALAFVIDFIIIDFVIGTPFRGVMTKLMPVADFSQSYTYLSTHPQTAALLSAVVIAFGILALFYFALLEYKIGQTIGKIFMNIKVESDTKQLTFFSCLIRNMALLFVFPFVILWILDPLFLLFNKDGRRLSEILSKTRTIERYMI